MSKIEDEVCEKIQARAEVGLKKYGTTMEREDFSELDWMTYLQEELMDSVVYLQRMINDERTYPRSLVDDERTLNNQITKLIALLPERKLDEFVEWLEEQES